MRVALVRIGNSRGVRIPKAVIEQCGFGDTVVMRVEGDRLVLAPDHLPREGWVFRAAGPAADDALLLDPPPSNDFDREWRW